VIPCSLDAKRGRTRMLNPARRPRGIANCPYGRLQIFFSARAALRQPALGSETLEATLEKYARADLRHQHAELLNVVKRWMVLQDTPAHTESRRALQGFMTPGHPRRMEGFTSTVIEETLARLAPDDDLVVAVAERIPVQVMAELLGLPPAAKGGASRHGETDNRRGRRLVNSSRSGAKSLGFVESMYGMR